MRLQAEQGGGGKTWLEQVRLSGGGGDGPQADPGVEVYLSFT